MMLSARRAVALSLLAEAVTLAATFAVFGVGVAGAQIAARNTARVSALIFSLALAGRTGRALGTGLAYGFVAAHLAHYASVVYFAAVASGHPLRHWNAGSVIAVAGGLFLVASFALTTGASAVWARRLNSVVLVVIWLAFMLALGANSFGAHAQPARSLPCPFR